MGRSNETGELRARKWKLERDPPELCHSSRRNWARRLGVDLPIVRGRVEKLEMSRRLSVACLTSSPTTQENRLLT